MQPFQVAFFMLCVRCFLNASFYAKAQNSDASFRIRRKSGFADYIFLLKSALVTLLGVGDIKCYYIIHKADILQITNNILFIER